MKTFPKFGLSLLAFCVATIAICLAWLQDHRNLNQQLQNLEHRDVDALLDVFENSKIWMDRSMPVDPYLANYSEIEANKNLINILPTAQFSDNGADFVFPTYSTLDKLLVLLDSESENERLVAIELLGYYAIRNKRRTSTKLSRPTIVATHRYFKLNASPKLFRLLNDSNPTIRGKSAAFLALIGYDRKAALAILLAHQSENDAWAKQHFRWALSRIFRGKITADELHVAETRN